MKKSPTTKPAVTKPARPRRAPLCFTLCECTDNSPVPEEGGPWQVSAEAGCPTCGGTGVLASTPGAGFVLRMTLTPCSCHGGAGPCAACDHTGIAATDATLFDLRRESERAGAFLLSLARQLSEADPDERGALASAGCSYLETLKFYAVESPLLPEPLFAAGMMLAGVAKHSAAGRDNDARALAEGLRALLSGGAAASA